MGKTRLFLLACGLLVESSALAGFRLTLIGSNIPNIRMIGHQTDYYEGWGFGGMMSVTTGSLEFLASYLKSAQAANYNDLTPGPSVSEDQYLDLGFRLYPGNERIFFFQFSGAGVLSNNFPSPRFGGTFGGGAQWMMSKNFSTGISTLGSFVPYSGYQRRFLRISLELSVNFGGGKTKAVSSKRWGSLHKSAH